MHIDSPQDIFKLLTQFKTQDREQLICFSMKDRQKIITKQIIDTGSRYELFFDLKKLFKTPILTGANSIIIAHNHPNGVIYPSQADIRTTLRIKEAGKYLNIQLIDHIIFTTNLVYSFSENNLI